MDFMPISLSQLVESAQRTSFWMGAKVRGTLSAVWYQLGSDASTDERDGHADRDG